MAQPPEPIALQTQNFPSDYKPLLDLVIPLFQRQFDQNRACLAGGVDSNNLAAKDVTFTVNVPGTEAWISINNQLGSGWTSTTAVSNGFAAPRYRVNASGQLQFSGAMEHNAALGALPVTLVSGLPVTQYNEDMITWIQVFDGSGNKFQGTALVRMDNSGALTLRAWSVTSTSGSGTANAVEFLSLDNIFYTPLLPNPGVYSVFPITVPVPFSKPSAVELLQIQDTGSSPPPTILGGIDWTWGDFQKIVVRNVTGLVIGRQYQVTLRVWP